MRARHRHFNARDSGADMVLDARFISQGNGTAVASWVDRSGNGYNADQATAAKQPTFETAGVAGQGSVKFDGGDVLDISNGYTDLMSGNDSFTIIALSNVSSFANAPVFFANDPNFFVQFGNMSPIVYNVGKSGAYLGYSTNSNSALSVNTSYVNTFTRTGSTTSILFNNGTEQTSTSGSLSAQAVASGSLFIGAYSSAASFPINGYINVILFFKTDLTNAQRKRCEQAIARSYKISCN